MSVREIAWCPMTDWHPECLQFTADLEQNRAVTEDEWLNKEQFSGVYMGSGGVGKEN